MIKTDTEMFLYVWFCAKDKNFNLIIKILFEKS